MKLVLVIALSVTIFAVYSDPTFKCAFTPIGFYNQTNFDSAYDELTGNFNLYSNDDEDWFDELDDSTYWNLMDWIISEPYIYTLMSDYNAFAGEEVSKIAMLNYVTGQTIWSKEYYEYFE